MKSYRKELWFNTPGRRAFLNITPEVTTCLRESGITEGLVLVNAMHITASVGIATLEGKEDTPEILFQRADRALYSAKRKGRNRVFADAA